MQSKGSIEGTLSANGLTIQTLSANETEKNLTLGDINYQSKSLTNLPYNADHPYDNIELRFAVSGASVRQFIKSFRLIIDDKDLLGKPRHYESTSAEYTNSDYIYVTFRE